ncbi:MAG: hypothetical protein JXM70_12440 [Pirellulales bacterium]|nr:hypothetical protein [Pirellulales bacterium]
MVEYLTRRKFISAGTGLAASGLSLPRWASGAAPSGTFTLENDFLKYVVGPDARSLHFIDKQTGRDFCGGGGKAPLARIKKNGKLHDASSAVWSDGCIRLTFGSSNVEAVLRAEARDQYLVFEVVSVTGDHVEEFTFVDIPLTLKGTPDESFAACALALNLQTKVNELPKPASRIRAFCYPRFEMAGARVALAACPSDKMRGVLQQIVTDAPELPQSPIGGPFAMGKPINAGSYLFNFGDMTVEKADDWIKLATDLGMNQIDFHGGNSFRFGDCRPNPKTYPQGFKSLKAVIDKLHGAGIKAGLHTYAFFINKSCSWITPVPDPRLAKDATFTLAKDLLAGADAVPVVETTEKMSTITGFFVRNSVTLRIDDELITYSGISKTPPYAFTACRRGACGTKVSAHAKGAKVYHLKECFGLFVPDPETTLFEEVAACTAEAFNTCGFDMIYLDALDGEDILGGRENGWHYGSRFVYEIWKRLKRPALMEMSTFHHHLWCVRSRFCAWDHPTRSHKKFIDLHCAANEDSRRMFLPGELGWWALKSWSGAQTEPTFDDDIEYLMAKCLGTDTGFALMGINPSNVASVPALPKLAKIIKRYENLRHSGKVSESIKARLREPGAEFTLSGDLHSGWQFRPVEYAKHKVVSREPWSSRWKTNNRFATQPLQLRIEALMTAGPYETEGNVVVSDFSREGDFPARAVAGGVTAQLRTSKEQVKVGPVSGCITAASTAKLHAGTWAKFERTFSPPINLSKHQALGLWIHGDGQGQLLNIQLRSPHHLSHAIGDHYIDIDFSGWRYFELIEPEGERYSDYKWPYSGHYAIYRESVRFDQVETLGIWLNNLPPGKATTCYISPIKALPLVTGKLVDPSVILGGRTLTLPVEIPAGHYLELHAADNCKLFGPRGEFIRDVVPRGELPIVQSGQNDIEFQAGTVGGANPRAKVTVITEGTPI